MELIQKLKSTEKIAEKIITRLFNSWIAACLIFLLINNKLFTDLEFFKSINIFIFAGITIAIFLVQCFIKNENLISLIMITLSFIYCICGSYQCSDFYFLSSCCGVISAVVYYARIREFNFKISEKLLWIGAVALILIFAVPMSISCCLRYKNYYTPCYDFGIFSQMFYYMNETGTPFVTCERDCLLSHFSVHFSPAFYLIYPIYKLFPTPMTLMAVQCLLPALGVIPLIKICLNRNLSNLSSLGFAACYLLYLPIGGSCNYYIHENNFLPPMLLFLLYFMEKNKTAPALIFGLLTLLTKEDSPVYTALIALYFIFAGKNYKCSIILFFISVVYFIAVTHYLSVFGDGVMTSRYQNYIYDDSGSLFTVIKAVMQNPLYVMQQSITEAKIKYILQMLLPILFLPLCIKKPSSLILLIPFVLVNLMTNYRYQYDIMYQYGFGSGTLLMYLAVDNFSKIKKGQGRTKLFLCCLLSSVIMFFGTFGEWLSFYHVYDYCTDSRTTIDYALKLIPHNASVACSTFILPNLSQRKEIYQLETTINTADYYVLDLRFDTDEYNLFDFQSPEYKQIYLKEEVIAIFQKNSN